ncbi:DUF1294 domain-containing protein [Halobacillus litoralis]|uniref:DUF1294 domain-containing protein n=1 Tax=Halobacillus litoralis TaxID=45668 RepID=UPI001CFE4F42|nr:DUF1294 domain-containing protein [Halobacillus litoralis]
MGAELFVLFYYLLMNTLLYVQMGRDKKRAERGSWRIKEKNLWVLAFLGGALGGTLGMKNYRHKTKHTAFKAGFPFLAFLQLAGLFILVTRFYL